MLQIADLKFDEFVGFDDSTEVKSFVAKAKHRDDYRRNATSKASSIEAPDEI